MDRQSLWTAPIGRKGLFQGSIRKASRYHGSNPSIAGEEGRLSLLSLSQPTWLRTCFDFLEIFCRCMAHNKLFSTLTTLLTLYALFGDDVRLLWTEKSLDKYFDYATIFSMAVFGTEILVCSIGKHGYRFGFFFWLDLISTTTLILDITYVAEYFFGDSVSAAARNAADAQDFDSSQDSSEAARAARMSRAGTKASRIIRLVRIVRLVRLLKLLKRTEKHGALPGYDWGDDDDDIGTNSESAVSKKLSEKTTRIVIMLVLVIMLAMPFFQPSFVGDDAFEHSAQSGLNMIYRLFNDGVAKHRPELNASNREIYLNSVDRLIYENDFRQYIYYHNWYCGYRVPEGKRGGPASTFSRLFFIGVEPPKRANADLVLPAPRENQEDWDKRWSGEEWDYYQCKIPLDARQLLVWNMTRLCLGGSVRGVSLAAGQDSFLDCPQGIRFTEREVLYPTVVTESEMKEGLMVMVVFDRRAASRFEAGLNLAQTVFICVILGFGAVSFTNDADKLVLKPIERMISKIDKIRSNPLAALTIGEAAYGRGGRENGEDEEDVKPYESRNIFWRCYVFLRYGDQRVEPEPVETKVLETTILKIGSLLALGFGEGGAAVISHNVKASEKASINTNIPGRKAEAVFASCEVRNFLTLTDLLAEQVTLFVNSVASIIHSCAGDMCGHPLINSGSYFLLVWRMSDEAVVWKKERYADLALVAMAKMAVQISKSKRLAGVKNHPRLAKRLPNYRCRVGVGLHYGVAIEGAVGSEFKIDAAYLGPTVSIATSLSDATHDYGCAILVSQPYLKTMSSGMAEQCRVVDKINVAGTGTTFRLFTLDLDDLALAQERASTMAAKMVPERASLMPAPTMSQRLSQRTKLTKRQKRAQRLEPNFDTTTLIREDPDIKSMRASFTTELRARYHMGFLNYEAGDWFLAREQMEKTRYMIASEDGPSVALLKYMKQFNYRAPSDWKGFRVLVRGCS